MNLQFPLSIPNPKIWNLKYSPYWHDSTGGKFHHGNLYTELLKIPYKTALQLGMWNIGEFHVWTRIPSLRSYIMYVQGFKNICSESRHFRWRICNLDCCCHKQHHIDPYSESWSNWQRPHQVFGIHRFPHLMDKETEIQKLDELSKATQLVHSRTQTQTLGCRVYAFSTWANSARWDQTWQMACCVAASGRPRTPTWYSLTWDPESQTMPNHSQ